MTIAQLLCLDGTSLHLFYLLGNCILNSQKSRVRHVSFILCLSWL